MASDDEIPYEGGTFGQTVARGVVELRRRYPQLHGIEVDTLFLAYLIETARFGLFHYGPVSIDVEVVEDAFVRAIKAPQAEEPHRVAPSWHAFYGRLGEEIERAGTRRPNELHYLLAFMRTPEGLPARIFGELGVPPEAVEAYARQTLRGNAPDQTHREAFLSPDEVARRLGVNEQTVRVWIRSGKLPASRLAGRRVLRIRESDIEAVLEPVDPADFQ